MDTTAKEKLLGSVKTTGSEKVYNPDPKILKEDLHHEEAFISGFCEECGSYLEFSQGQIKKNPIGGIVVEDLDPSSQYIHTDGCTVCLNTDNSMFEVRVIPGTN